MLGVDAAGNAFVAYTQKDEVIDLNDTWVVRYAADTDTWEQAKRIDTNDVNNVYSPDIAVDPAGNAIVCAAPRASTSAVLPCHSVAVRDSTT